MKILFVDKNTDFFEDFSEALGDSCHADFARYTKEESHISRSCDYDAVVVSVGCLEEISDFSSFFSRAGICEDGEVKIDQGSQKVFICGKEIPFRKKEYDIFKYLFLNRNRFISEENILSHVWMESDLVFSNTVAVHISRIRKKIQKVLGEDRLKTVRGFGYKIEV